MAPLLSYQPFKGFATLALAAFAPPYLIALSLFYSVKRLRPVSSWSFRTAIGSAWLRLFYIYATRIRLRPFYANASKLEERYVLVQPGPSDLYTGVLQHEDIKPVAMPAVWFPAAPKREELRETKVVLHFQGGAFVTASDLLETGQLPANIFEKKLGVFTLWAQYRLARDETSRFPAALQDVVTFYHYILKLGVNPKNVLVSGDSAGGHLVIGLLRYISSTKLLSAPHGAMLWSPCVDVSANALPRYKHNRNLHTDFLPLGLIQWGFDAFTPAIVTGEVEKYLRHVEHPFATSVSVFVNVGSKELLYDEISLFVARMKEVRGNKIEYVETEDAPHDMFVACGWLGLVKEAEDAVDRAKSFFGS